MWTRPCTRSGRGGEGRPRHSTRKSISLAGSSSPRATEPRARSHAQRPAVSAEPTHSMRALTFGGCGPWGFSSSMIAARPPSTRQPLACGERGTGSNVPGGTSSLPRRTNNLPRRVKNVTSEGRNLTRGQSKLTRDSESHTRPGTSPVRRASTYHRVSGRSREHGGVMHLLYNPHRERILQ